MKRLHSLHFESLETRNLLSTAHPAVPVVETPVALGGTLAVDLKDAQLIQNADGSETTAVPVTGRLGTVGKVTGTWNQSVDSFGNYEGPDTLVLSTHTPKGSITIAFNNNNAGTTSKPVGHGISFFQHAQRLVGGSSAFNKSSEHGSIELMLNTDKETYQGLVLISVTP